MMLSYLFTLLEINQVTFFPIVYSEQLKTILILMEFIISKITIVFLDHFSETERRNEVTFPGIHWLTSKRECLKKL
jgi:hypothetical protein